jgi:hypothetical protein
MIPYDPTLSAREIAEARKYIAVVVGPHPSHLDSPRKLAVEIDRLGAIDGMIDRHAVLAAQLEAAGQEVVDREAERVRMRDSIEELQIARNTLLAEAEGLRRLRGRLKARIRHLAHVGCSLCGDRAQDLRDLLEE